MNPIQQGTTGAAVEDIQERLCSLGYHIDATELEGTHFGTSTALAVAKFRLDHSLSLSEVVDSACWSALVDECYQLGDRTLYLRLPNFHGNDVRQLQERLNILGFSCGDIDGVFGVHTEAAVKLFQESVGALADGMAFADTFNAIERLRHVWSNKPSHLTHPVGTMGFARAAHVLEHAHLALTAVDPISRNVAGRIWNLAHATVEHCTVDLIDDPQDCPSTSRALIILSSTTVTHETLTEDRQTGAVGSVALDDIDTLPSRLTTALHSSDAEPPCVRLELPVGEHTFTVGDAQTFAVLVLDALCAAFA